MNTNYKQKQKTKLKQKWEHGKRKSGNKQEVMFMEELWIIENIHVGDNVHVLLLFKKSPIKAKANPIIGMRSLPASLHTLKKIYFDNSKVSIKRYEIVKDSFCK
jgi:hypothetical protein